VLLDGIGTDLPNTYESFTGIFEPESGVGNREVERLVRALELWTIDMDLFDCSLVVDVCGMPERVSEQRQQRSGMTRVPAASVAV